MQAPIKHVSLPRVDGIYDYDSNGIVKLSKAVYVFDIYKYEMNNMDSLLSGDYKTVLSLLHAICYSYTEDDYSIDKIKQYFLDKYDYTLNVINRFDKVLILVIVELLL